MTTDYAAEAETDALSMIQNFNEQILEQLKDKGKASNDLLNDYSSGDSYHHETHVDKEYDLSEAAELLDQLNEYEETDSGLWEGRDPREAISAQAAYTYGNAVMTKWQEKIKEVNDKWEELNDLLQF